MITLSLLPPQYLKLFMPKECFNAESGAMHLVGTEAVWHVQVNCCSYRNLANMCIFSNTLSSVVLIPAFVRVLTKHIPRANGMHRWLRVTQFHGFVACAYFWRLRRWHAEKDFCTQILEILCWCTSTFWHLTEGLFRVSFKF